MEKAVQIVRYVLALILVVFGLNKFFQFMPMPEMAPGGQAFMESLVATGYMLGLIGLTELASGILIIFPATAALGAVILAPLTLNIILFHLFLDPGNILVGFIVFAANVFLIYAYRYRYFPILSGAGVPLGSVPAQPRSVPPPREQIPPREAPPRPPREQPPRPQGKPPEGPDQPPPPPGQGLQPPPTRPPQ